MQTNISNKINFNHSFSEKDLLKGVYVVMLHATRIPPHIGIVVDKKYFSLTIKGQEINHSIEALIKNINIRKIPTVFFKIKSNSTFTTHDLKEKIINHILQFKAVEIDVATCLSPVKLFFEAYTIQTNDVNYIYELIPKLAEEELIETCSSLFVDEANYQLPIYNQQQIDDEIKNVKNIALSILNKPKKNEIGK